MVKVKFGYIFWAISASELYHGFGPALPLSKMRAETLATDLEASWRSLSAELTQAQEECRSRLASSRRRLEAVPETAWVSCGSVCLVRNRCGFHWFSFLFLFSVCTI